MRKLKFNVVKWMGSGSPPDVAALPATAPAPAYDAAAMGDKRVCMGWTGPAGWLDEKGDHVGWGDLGYGVRAVQRIVSRRKAPHNLVLARVEALQKVEPCETKKALKRRIAQVQADLDLQALPTRLPPRRVPGAARG